MSLRRVIEEEIGRHGPIPFSRYMELCLYHPELGYYSRPQEKFGKTGDFYTSSDVHAVFGRLLARQFEEMWRALGSPGRFDICEFGNSQWPVYRIRRIDIQSRRHFGCNIARGHRCRRFSFRLQ